MLECRYHGADAGESFDFITDAEREIFIDKLEMSIFELHRRYQRGDILLRPFYQRKDVWNRIKKSRLIESVLRNIPIPAIYLAEMQDGSFEVVDGQQRLRAFFDFMEDAYKLSKIPVLNSLNGKSFSEIDLRFQRKIEDSQLYIFVIKKESHPDIKFDIYERINEGAVKLNVQELRNCIFRGRGMELVRELAELDSLKHVFGKRLSLARGKDEELVLRFLSFYAKGYRSYNGNINSFLNDTLLNFDSYSQNLYDIKKIFDETMMTCSEVFGDSAFVKNSLHGCKFNISLYEIISVSFAHGNRKKIAEEQDYIRRSLENLLKDRAFYNSITLSTLSKENVCYRFKKWDDVMEAIR